MMLESAHLYNPYATTLSLDAEEGLYKEQGSAVEGQICHMTKAQIKTTYSPACAGLCLRQLPAVSAIQLPHLPFPTQAPDFCFLLWCSIQ